MLNTRVILADDHQLILDALKKLLEPEFAVVGTFGDGHATFGQLSLAIAQE